MFYVLAKFLDSSVFLSVCLLAGFFLQWIFFCVLFYSLRFGFHPSAVVSVSVSVNIYLYLYRCIRICVSVAREIMLWCTHVKLTLQLQLLFNIVWPAKTLETCPLAFATLAAFCGNSIRWLDSGFVCNYYALIAGGTTWLRCLPVRRKKK